MDKLLLTPYEAAQVLGIAAARCTSFSPPVSSAA